MLVIGPPGLLLVLFLGGALVFRWTVQTPASVTRVPSAIAGRFFTRYVLWLLDPIERWLARLAISPNTVTLVSFIVAVGAAALLVAGWYALAGWAVAISGMLDIVDGRIARRTGRSSPAGALLDSVADRWGELVITVAILHALRDSALGSLAAVSLLLGAQMVSYTRARGEALGIALLGGTMQRPERIVAITGALLLGGLGHDTGWFDATLVMAIVIGTTGVWCTITALQRLLQGMRALETFAARDARAPVAIPVAKPAGSRRAG